MTRTEYMQKVENALKGYDRTFAQEIIDNYNEHFETALKEGRSEEDICQELGGVEELLKGIKEFMGDKDLSTKEIEKYTAVAVQDIMYTGIRKAELELTSIDVKVMPSADNELHVYIDEGKDKAKYLEERISGDSYFARQLKRKQSGNFLERILSSVNEEEVTVIVEVPAEMDSLIIKTMSGDIEAKDIYAKAMKLEAMSGDIMQSGVKAEESFIKTMSGDIALKDVDGKEIVVQSTSGDVSWKGVGVEETEIKTISGGVSMTDVNTNKAGIKTTSGDISFRSSEVGALDVSSVSGDIGGVLYADKIKAHTTSGDIRLTMDRRGKALVTKSKTVSGDCHVYGESEWVGEPDPEKCIIAEFSTVSGDVKIK